MTTIDIEEAIEIDAPAAAAWAVIADYERDPEWRESVTQMTPTPRGLVQVGTTTAEVMRFAGKTMENDGEVTAVRTGSRFAWRTTRGAEAHGSRAVEPLGPERCRVDLALHVGVNGAERLMAPMFRRLLRRNQRADLERLRELVVSQHRGSGVTAAARDIG